MTPLFALQADPPLSVTQVNTRAKTMLERTLGVVRVLGEISNLKIVSGHCYFTLKDQNSQLAAVLFKQQLNLLPFKLSDGQQVIVTGRLTVFSQYGRYQIVIDKVENYGIGALQLAFEQLKKRLEAEGLFAQERKKSLPRLPKKVGVITSPTGAVIRDIVHVALRRFPKASIVVIPTKVQGADAAPSLVAAIQRASTLDVDVLILARGGGSYEDLWGFNDEHVARAIVACPLPLVSAIGHETDFTIADFVADCRAPTPSAAAELVFPLYHDLVLTLQNFVTRLTQRQKRECQNQRYKLQAFTATLGDGKSWLRTALQQLTHLHVSLERNEQKRLLHYRMQLQRKEAQLTTLHPKIRLQQSQHRLHKTQESMQWLLKTRLTALRNKLKQQQQKVQALSPLGVLERGYSIVLNKQGQAIREQHQVGAQEQLQIKLWQGSLTVTNVTE